MSLADILAKKKAAAEAANSSVELRVPAAVAEAVKADPAGAVAHLQKEADAMMPKSFEKVEEKMKEENNTPAGKPLTFAEKMALKKAQTAAPAVVAQTITEPVTVTSDSSATQSEPPVSSAAAETEALRTAVVAADTETAQAYADIHARIEALADLSDTPLEGAMSALKKALMANPNAVSLMLDSDYAQMVVALRRLTKEDQLEAAKEKTTGKKRAKKTVDFTNADEVQAVFDEL